MTEPTSQPRYLFGLMPFRWRHHINEEQIRWLYDRATKKLLSVQSRVDLLWTEVDSVKFHQLEELFWKESAEEWGRMQTNEYPKWYYEGKNP